MGCQTEIANAIVNGGGNYLLAVKTNQPSLHADIVATFVEADDERRRTIDEQPRPAVETAEDIDKGHGRIEKRTVRMCRDLSWLNAPTRWTGLRCVVQVTRERTMISTGITTTETAYYIGSDPVTSASTAGHRIRRHWAIENELHWVLDVGFHEDARHRARNAAQNMTILRHFSINIVKCDKNRKLGVANSRKRAGWDRGYLLELLEGAAE